MEAFVLAHGLRMIGPRVADPDALLDQPDPERGVRVARSVAPGRTVVCDQPLGQTVASEGEMSCCLTVSVCSLAQAASTTAKREWSSSTVSGWSRPACRATWPLKSICHNSFGRVSLEPGEVRTGRRRVRPVRSHAASGSPSPSRAPESLRVPDPSGACDLAAAPGRMLRAHRKHGFLPWLRRCATRFLRSTRRFLKPRHPVAAANAPAICSRSSGSPRSDGTACRTLAPSSSANHHKFQSRCPFRTPRGTASDSLLDSLSKVSTMSPNTRPPVPGLYPQERGRTSVAATLQKTSASPSHHPIDAAHTVAARSPIAKPEPAFAEYAQALPLV